MLIKVKDFPPQMLEEVFAELDIALYLYIKRSLIKREVLSCFVIFVLITIICLIVKYEIC